MSAADTSNPENQSLPSSKSTPRDRITVVREAENRLQQSHYSALRRVSCDYQDSVLTSRGQLPSYYLKQAAQTLSLKTPGIEEISNRITILQPTRSDRPKADDLE